jgi:hypothetical protein
MKSLTVPLEIFSIHHQNMEEDTLASLIETLIEQVRQAFVNHTQRQELSTEQQMRIYNEIQKKIIDGYQRLNDITNRGNS